MKALPKKFLPLILFAIAVTSLFSVQPAQAYTVTLQQVGSNVVATGSGAINLTGLSFPIPSLTLAEVNAGDGVIITGPHGFGPVDQYTGFMGPPSFGSGGPFAPNTGSGDFVGISGGTMFTFLWVPQGYASGAALSDSMTFNNATFASLGVTPGTYVWTWGMERTRTSRSRSGRWVSRVSRMAAPQFLCSVSLCSAWLPCGAN